jgi:uncharacterized OsmC-like protein
MDSETLRARQAPIKQQYREQPALALVTLRASGKVTDGITCSVDTGRALVAAGLHPATGGDGLSVCSGDMLLEALVACAGVTLNAVATALDFCGTLGVDREAPVGFRAIRLFFDLPAALPEDKKASLLKLTERYCVVFQTLRTPPALHVEAIAV